MPEVLSLGLMQEPAESEAWQGYQDMQHEGGLNADSQEQTKHCVTKPARPAFGHPPSAVFFGRLSETPLGLHSLKADSQEQTEVF
jgi:hypothetical protein